MSDNKDKTPSARRPAKGKTAAEAIVTAVAVLAALVLLNVVVGRSSVRLDLTENQLYTLSSASQMLVRSLPEKVTVRGYFGNVPAEHDEKLRYVDMLLGEYAELSDGKISYEKIDPGSDKKLQQELAQEGVNKLKLQSLQEGEYKQIEMYFHVVFEHLDKKEVWVPDGGFSLEGLEYDFTTRIKRLGHGKKKVAVTTGFGEPAQAQALAAPGVDVMRGLGIKVGLGDLYEVTPVDWAKDPSGLAAADVIIVNGPTQKVSDQAKLALDQAIMNGKGVFFLVSGMSWQAGGGQQMMMEQEQPFIGMPGDNGLDDLLAHHGFKVGKDVILDARNSGKGMIPPGSGQGGIVVEGAFWPAARSLAAGERELLQGIKALLLPFPSSLELVGPLAGGKSTEERTVIPLLETFETSFARSEMLAITPQWRWQEPPAGARKRILAGVAVSGTWKSFYPQPPAGTAPPEGGLKAESPGNTRIVVITSPGMVADATLMDVQMTMEVAYLNGFVAAHNLVDWLAEDVDLVAVRSKKVERRLENIEDGTRTVIKVANLFGPPLLLIAAGIVAWRLRERRRKNVSL